LAGGARCGVTADAGELEALREVADREAMCGKQFLGLGSGEASTQFGLTRDLVEVVKFVQPPQVQ